MTKEPTTPEELLELHKLRQANPQRYLQIANEWIRQDPRNPQSYFRRHLAWMEMGQPKRALEDMNKALELRQSQIGFLSRGEVYRELGQHQDAIDDFGRGEAMDPAQWEGDAMGLLYQADSHAHLGNEEAALAHCARLPDEFWTPGLHGAPAGNKAEIANELRRVATAARRGRNR